MVVYTGNDCKAIMDQGDGKKKISQTSYLTIYVIGSFFGLLTIILVAINYGLTDYKPNSSIKSHWYLP